MLELNIKETFGAVDLVRSVSSVINLESRSFSKDLISEKNKIK
jgi:hypothetical protein